MRGYMTGSTSTSLWTHYAAGERAYCGNTFPDGLRKNAKLAANVITPTTKAEDHDEPITPAEIVARGLMSAADWEAASAAALALFAYGQEQAAARGLLLVDTKYEFGKDSNGRITLIDEVHTPDSSRYWLAGSYAARHAAGQEPQNIDKEFLRLWFRDRCGALPPPRPARRPCLSRAAPRRHCFSPSSLTASFSPHHPSCTRIHAHVPVQVRPVQGRGTAGGAAGAGD